MNGINLSQSMQENKKASENKGALDKGLAGVLAVFLLVSAAWGWLEWHMGTLDKKIADLESSIQANTNSLSGKDETNRIGDFSDRSFLIEKASVDMLDSKEVLTQLESMMAEGIVLTKYEYNKDAGEALIDGTTDNFKYLAQQILVFKMSGFFSDVKVESLSKSNESGKISFSLRADLRSAVETVSAK